MMNSGVTDFLTDTAAKAKEAMGRDAMTVIADRGYFSGEEVLACEAIGVRPLVPKPYTSGARADGRFGKQDFVYLPDEDAYRCPAGNKLVRHMTVVEKGQNLHKYWDHASCKACSLKPRCTPSPERRVTRWEHEGVVDAMPERLELTPDAMTVRRHPGRSAADRSLRGLTA